MLFCAGESCDAFCTLLQHCTGPAEHELVPVGAAAAVAAVEDGDASTEVVGGLCVAELDVCERE